MATHADVKLLKLPQLIAPASCFIFKNDPLPASSQCYQSVSVSVGVFLLCIHVIIVAIGSDVSINVWKLFKLLIRF